MAMKRYVVVAEEVDRTELDEDVYYDLGNFQDNVGDLIEKGYQLVGGVSVVNVKENKTLYSQALVYKE